MWARVPVSAPSTNPSSGSATFADAWNGGLLDETDAPGETKRVRVKKDGAASPSAWLFGSDSDKHPSAGALQFSEARLLAFPIRSARGSFAWITCPLMLARADRDGVPGVTALSDALAKSLNQPTGADRALFLKSGPLAIGQDVVLEEYTFTHLGELPTGLGEALAKLLTEGTADPDPVWKEVVSRLVILSDGMMSFFARHACEVAQHVRISDETGTAEEGALFNQENVPSETLFYSIVRAADSRLKTEDFKSKTARDALTEFARQLNESDGFQFGGDASTGLGYCTLAIS